MSTQVERHTDNLPEWKTREVEEIREWLSSHTSIGICDVSGIPSRQFQQMRASLRGEVEIKVSRNTLVRLAAENVEGVESIADQLKDATDKGAEIKRHPGPLPNNGKYHLPAILKNVNHKMAIMMEETFGPVVGIMEVKSDEETISLMNDSPYGLTASVWTNDAKKATEIGNCIETGTFFMNRCDYLDPSLPWVGVKKSGKGCTLSTLGLQQLTRPKSYHLKLNS